MYHIFRAPVDNQHFKDTIENGKPFAEIAKFLDGEKKVQLQRITKEGIVRYWGSLPGESNKRSFAKLAESDELICYRSGKYIALAKIAFTTINPELAKYSWGVTQLGTTWELIYFFSNVIFFEIEAVYINKEFGFNYGPVMGFGAISDEKVKEFIQKYGSMDSFVKNLGYEEKVQKNITDLLVNIPIQKPFEAQYYLVELGNQLGYETYVPINDAGHTAFNKKLGELITVQQEHLEQYVPPAFIKPLSLIDVVWFKESYMPNFFYEVIHKTGISEALLRLGTVGKFYESAKTKIVGPKEGREKFYHELGLRTGQGTRVDYRDYDQLLNVHAKALHYKKVISEFLE